MAVPNRYSFADFVSQYGVEVADDIVFDMRSHETVPIATPLGTVFRPYPYWMQVPVADRKVAGGVDQVILPWASPLGITEAQVGRIEVIELLKTTEFGAIDFNYGNVGPNAEVFERVTEQNLVPSLMAVAITAPTGDTETEPFRIVVVGDADWLTDAVYSQAQTAGSALAANGIFLGVNLVDWLAQEAELASIRSKVISTRQLLFNSSSHKNGVQYANIIGVPVVFVVIGLFRFVRRRNIGLRMYAREE